MPIFGVCIYKDMFEKFEKIENADLKNFSTMKTGGRARFVFFPKNHLEIVEILRICKEKGLPYFVIGNGSNVLFDDKGFDGVLLSLKHFDKVKFCGKGLIEGDTVTDPTVWVGAGINLFALNIKLQKLGLSGLEFCYGIPATLGGFLVMNGGCFGHEICEFVEEVAVLENDKIKILKNDSCGFEYRHSNLSEKIVLMAKLRLKCEKSDVILQKMNSFYQKKRESQPCDLPSLGSVFKRKNGVEPPFPAKVIDDLGLKGFRIGGAEVSKKHAGFIVNSGGATSEDVLKLVEFLEEKLKEQGLDVEREILVLKNKIN